MMPSYLNFRRECRLCLLAIAAATAVAADHEPAHAGVLRSEVVVTTGLSLPIFATAPANDFDHLYVAEQKTARLMRLNLDTKQIVSVLDLPNPVMGTEAGLNGFTFHPDFANNGKVYVNISGNAEKTIRILEYTRSTVDPNQFDPASERTILTVPNPNTDHNGGWVDFGPDGYLYIATGDGGNIPPQETKGLFAQDVNDLRGKMLRVDVNNDDFPADPLKNYSIPENNPFAAGGGAPEIFAVGLRHPWRNSFDRQTGDLYIGDVGSRFWEEINFLPEGTNGGQNFGWRPREGFVDNPDWADPAPPGAIDPIYAYAHGAAAAVIGGYVYRGSEIPWLQGTYFFSDYSQRTFSSLRYDGETVTEVTDLSTQLASPLGSYGVIVSHAQDAAGEIYMIDFTKGDIYKISAVPPVELGDYDQNGIVDASDYTLWRDTNGRTGVPAFSGADGNGDGAITTADYDIWKAHFGTLTGATGGGGGAANVPEPATSVSIAVFIVGMGWLGRLRSRRICY